MNWYRSAYDAMRVTRRVIRRNADPMAITDKHGSYFGLPEEKCSAKIEDAIQELHNVVVLALVAVFERTLRNDVRARIRDALSATDPIAGAIRSALQADVEFWRFSERLVDVYTLVSEPVRGNIKQLIVFRNWVAHGHFTAEPAPTQTDPKQAYDRLTEFLQTANLI